jgi:hypothetical protein
MPAMQIYQINSNNMIKDSEIVTKKYFEKKLDQKFNEKLSDFVTKKYLKVELDKQRVDIIREVRIMMHETMESGMENMKLYYQEETNRHMTALLQGFKDEMLVYKDQFKSFMEKLDNHEHRIGALERV